MCQHADVYASRRTVNLVVTIQLTEASSIGVHHNRRYCKPLVRATNVATRLLYKLDKHRNIIVWKECTTPAPKNLTNFSKVYRGWQNHQIHFFYQKLTKHCQNLQTIPKNIEIKNVYTSRCKTLAWSKLDLISTPDNFKTAHGVSVSRSIVFGPRVYFGTEITFFYEN